MISRVALVLAAVFFAACGSDPPPVAPPSAPPPPPVADEAGARHAAEVALKSLGKRQYNITGCDAAETRVSTEAEAAAITVVNERCAIRVARRADKSWMVVIRSPSQLGNVSATITVSPGGEGVTHVDYKPEAGAKP